MTRLSDLPEGQPITVDPMQAFPVIKDLVTDVSWNFKVKQRIKPFKPRKPDAPDGTSRMDQRDADRVQAAPRCRVALVHPSVASSLISGERSIG